MRVLFAYKYLSVGGVETVLRARLDALPSQGIEAQAWFLHDIGGRAVFRGCGSRIQLGSVDELGRRLSAGGIDLLATIDTPEVLAFGGTAGRVPVVVECHSPYLENLEYLRDLAQPPVAEIWVPSEHQRRVVGTRCQTGISVEVVPNPLREIFLAPLVPFAAVPPRPVVAWIGRMDDLKNWRGFVSLAAEIAALGHACEFWLAGKPVEAGIASEFQSLLRAQGILGSLRWFREYPHQRLPVWLDAVRDSGGIVVSTSRGESLGMTVAEAMARACPVVAPRSGPFSEFVSDEESGLLFDPDLPGDAARRVSRLLREPHLRRRLGSAARIAAVSHFSTARTMTALVSRLRKILDSSAPAPN